METWYLNNVEGDVASGADDSSWPFALEAAGAGDLTGYGFKGPVVLAMGVFDGVHIGHAHVVERTRKIASRLGLPAAVLTFVEHPRSVLRPDRPVPLLSTWREKRDRLEALGLDRVVAAHFTPSFSQLSPDDFVRRLVVESLGAAHLVVGFNFRFGHRAAGSPDLLAALSRQHGYGLDVIEPFEKDGRPVSSSQIRELLATGFIADALPLLGGPYVLAGTVVGGDGRARHLGFPTANLAVDEQKLLPAYGVYAGHAAGPGGRYPCVVNIGIRPTFDPPQLKVEAHLLDFSGDLYGQTLTLELSSYIRPERAFSGLEALVEQIGQDVQEARSRLAQEVL